MYILTVNREGVKTRIQIGCTINVDFTWGLINYAMDRDEFVSFVHRERPLVRSAIETDRAGEYLDEYVESTVND